MSFFACPSGCSYGGRWPAGFEQLVLGTLHSKEHDSGKKPVYDIKTLVVFYVLCGPFYLLTANTGDIRTWATASPSAWKMIQGQTRDVFARGSSANANYSVT